MPGVPPPRPASKPVLRIGFLTSIETDEGDFVAGLLLTNRFGRPLEFQCTCPVSPNRAQRLLYGSTLRPYLIGELMARALLDNLEQPPDLLVTDQLEILELRQHVEVPIACLTEDESPATDSPSLRLGRRFLRVHPAHQSDVATFHDRADAIAPDADLVEPLDRVRSALSETLSTFPGTNREQRR